jgi:hypothetical protein
MDQKSDADILAETREYIHEHGWTRGTMQNPRTKKVCSLGGLCLSQGWWWQSKNGNENSIPGEYHETVARICNKVLAVAVGFPPLNYQNAIMAVTRWNDNLTDRNGQQEVEDAFAKAEKIERAGFDPDA